MYRPSHSHPRRPETATAIVPKAEDAMNIQRLAVGLTLVNLVLLVVVLSGQIRPAIAVQNVAPVLRGHALEILDAQGRVRASISVEPPTTVNSKRYPETVLLRLADPKSGPIVKLTASENGSALGLSDDARGGVSLYARDTGSFLKVVDKNGREQVIKP